MFAVKGLKREDLILVAQKCGQEVHSEMRIFNLIKLIEESTNFKDEPEVVEQLILTTVADRRAEVERRFQLELAMARNPWLDPDQIKKEIEAKICRPPLALSSKEHGNKKLQNLEIMTAVTDKLSVPDLMPLNIFKPMESARARTPDCHLAEGEIPEREEQNSLQASQGVETLPSRREAVVGNASEGIAENSPPEGSLSIVGDEGGQQKEGEVNGFQVSTRDVVKVTEEGAEDFREVSTCVLVKGRGTGQQGEKQLGNCVVLRREQVKVTAPSDGQHSLATLSRDRP